MIRFIVLHNLDLAKNTDFDGSDVADESNDVAQHVVGVREQSQRMCYMAGDYFDNKKSHGEEENEIELEWLKPSKPFFNGHSSIDSGAKERVWFV